MISHMANSWVTNGQIKEKWRNLAKENLSREAVGTVKRNGTVHTVFGLLTV